MHLTVPDVSACRGSVHARFVHTRPLAAQQVTPCHGMTIVMMQRAMHSEDNLGLAQ